MHNVTQRCILPSCRWRGGGGCSTLKHPHVLPAVFFWFSFSHIKLWSSVFWPLRGTALVAPLKFSPHVTRTALSLSCPLRQFASPAALENHHSEHSFLCLFLPHSISGSCGRSFCLDKRELCVNSCKNLQSRNVVQRWVSLLWTKWKFVHPEKKKSKASPCLKDE